MNGRFITVEGGEGVGKSLFINLISKKLKDLNIELINTFEPGGTPTANKLREIFVTPPEDDPLLITTEFCIVSAARAQHVGIKILPALQNNSWVISDRFADSSRVYQGMIGGIPDNILENIINFTTYNLNPDLTFILDCDTEVALERLKNRTDSKKGESLSRFDKEHIDFHKKLRQCFLSLEQKFKNRIIILNAEKTPEQIVDDAMIIIKNKFNLT